ncbi:ABC transporter ATP-binding protein [Actinospongicola halichondriae]|uniref:ABC transporter ATP-binding protein n=1 Tax=Actinospongicola halichondriae TaxID=3236844 RepID=UPI003D38EC35
MTDLYPDAPPSPDDPGSTTTGVVSLDAVHRTFGTTPALAGLSFDVPEKSITVLLGPNGAGKTTCTRIITGALGADSGDVRVFGLDPTVDGEEVRRRCGVVSAKPALYDRLSGMDNLGYAAELYGLGRGQLAHDRIMAASDRFGIVGALESQVGGYSTGMKTRLALARSVLHEPDLLLYDEPTSGLDPESSYAVLELIREMTGDGNTVVMCTHLLLEAEGLADQVVMLQDGRSLISGTPDDLVRQYWPDDTVVFDAEDRSSLTMLSTLPGVLRSETGGKGTTVAVDRLDRVPDLVHALSAAGVRLTRVEVERHTLENLYFAVRRSSGDNRIGEVHA